MPFFWFTRDLMDTCIDEGSRRIFATIIWSMLFPVTVSFLVNSIIDMPKVCNYIILGYLIFESFNVVLFSDFLRRYAPENFNDGRSFHNVILGMCILYEMVYLICYVAASYCIGIIFANEFWIKILGGCLIFSCWSFVYWIILESKTGRSRRYWFRPLS